MDAAFHYLLSAGDDALRLFAIRDAITIYEQAQQFMHEEDWQTKIPLSEQRHLYVQLGRAYELNDELEKARATYSEMLACAKAHSEPEMEREALNRLDTVTAHVAANVAQVQRVVEQGFPEQ